jgi:hypothetical protein
MMKRTIEKFIVILVAALMCTLMFSGASAEDQLSVRFSKFKNAYPENAIYTGAYASRECKGYVEDFFSTVFLVNIPGTADNDYSFNPSSAVQQYSQVVFNDNAISAADVQRAFSGVPTYSIIQMHIDIGDASPPHTAIIVSAEDSYAHLWDANWTTDPNQRNIVRVHDMSYASLANMISFPGGGFTIYTIP